QSLLAKPGGYERPHLSPDGQRLALEVIEESTHDIWIYGWQRDTMTRLTFDAGGAGGMNPVWSPDGRYIVFWGKRGIVWIRSDGAGKQQPLIQSKAPQVPWSFSLDGNRLAAQEVSSRGAYILGTLPLDSLGSGLKAGNPDGFLKPFFDERHPMFPPNGRW